MQPLKTPMQSMNETVSNDMQTVVCSQCFDVTHAPFGSRLCVCLHVLDGSSQNALLRLLCHGAHSEASIPSHPNAVSSCEVL